MENEEIIEKLIELEIKQLTSDDFDYDLEEINEYIITTK